MEEIGILLLVALVLVAASLGAWRLIRGPARSRRHLGLRALGVAVVALLLLAFGVYQLMNSRTVQVFGTIVPRVETAAPVVALTFDDGPTPAVADEILSDLRARSVLVTFFLIGQNIEQNMNLCRQLASAGHEIGNHTYSHDRMVFVPYAYVQDEIERTDRLIRECGYQGTIHFRPPNTKKLFLLPYYLAQNGRPDITVDVEPDSYPEVASSAERIAAYVLNKVRPGSIILLHVWPTSRSESLRAVPDVIQGLQAHGYRLVTVSELLSQTAPISRR